MTVSAPLGVNDAALSGVAAKDDPVRLHQVSQQFEAIFLRQILSAARATDFGGDDLFGGQSEETFAEMRDALFADLASQTGALGFAASIEKQLARFIGPKG